MQYEKCALSLIALGRLILTGNQPQARQLSLTRANFSTVAYQNAPGASAVDKLASRIHSILFLLDDDGIALSRSYIGLTATRGSSFVGQFFFSPASVREVETLPSACQAWTIVL